MRVDGDRSITCELNKVPIEIRNFPLTEGPEIEDVNGPHEWDESHQRRDKSNIAGMQKNHDKRQCEVDQKIPKARGGNIALSNVPIQGGVVTSDNRRGDRGRRVHIKCVRRVAPEWRRVKDPPFEIII